MWEWIDGTEIEFTNWMENEPNGGNTNNCGLVFKSAGEWRDFTCSQLLSAVCERNKLS